MRGNGMRARKTWRTFLLAAAVLTAGCELPQSAHWKVKDKGERDTPPIASADAVRVSSTHGIHFDSSLTGGGEWVPLLVGRKSARPLVVALSAPVDEHSFADLQLFEVAGETPSLLATIKHLNTDVRAEIRCPSECGPDALFTLPASIGKHLLEIAPLDATASFTRVRPLLASEAAVRSGDNDWFVGLGSDWNSLVTAETDRIVFNPDREETESLAAGQKGSFDIGVFSKPAAQADAATLQLKGWGHRFGDQALRNLDITLTSDGILHIIGVQLLARDQGSVTIRHIQFDTGRGRWIGNNVLASHAGREAQGSRAAIRESPDKSIDAFWAFPGAGPNSGLFASRIGENGVYRLAASTPAFAVLEDADGAGALLVGDVSGDGSKVDWHIRKADRWYAAGATAVGAPVETSLSRFSQGFALWRGDDNTVHAGFMTEGGMLFEDLKLPSLPQR